MLTLKAPFGPIPVRIKQPLGEISAFESSSNFSLRFESESFPTFLREMICFVKFLFGTQEFHME